MASKSREIRLRQLCFALFGTALILRIAIAATFQSRSWVDELWVMMNPAYHLLTGLGQLNPQDWGAAPQGLRSWIAPSLLYFFLQILDWLGIHRGDTVIMLVRVSTAVISAISIAALIRITQKQFQLKTPPWVALLIALFVPQFIHYGSLLDLSVIAFPFFVAGLWFWENSKHKHAFVVGSVFFALSIVIRSQFILFAVLYALYLVFKTREYSKLYRFLGVNLAVLAIDTIYNSILYKRPIVPIWNYLLANAVGGVGNDAGTMPLGAGFEFLWRFTTEPVFILIALMLPFAFRRAFFITLCGSIYLALHLVLAHKEFRYFYAPAVILTVVAAVALQAWVEENKAKPYARKAGLGFLALFAVFALWRGTSKTPWNEFEIPAKLETYAGIQSDVKGLLVYGWGGIYCGGQYAFHRTLPYVCEERRGNFKGLKLSARAFNYVVTGKSERAPCRDLIRESGGGSLYRCSTSEVEALIR